MYRPAGYSDEDSDEDDFDEFGYFHDFKPNTKKTNNWNALEDPTPVADYDSLLYNAVLDGNLEEVKRILSLAEHLRAGACLRQGWPVLFYACYEANLAIAEYLIVDVKVDVKRSYNLETALMTACSSPKPTEQVYPVVRMLLEYGAIIGVLDRYGWSPLMVACKAGHLAVAKELVGESSLMSVDNDGNTALFHAVKNNRYEIVKVLLRAGAQTNLVNREGFTPKQCAINSNYKEIVELLPAEEDSYVLPIKYMTYGNYRNFIHGETELDPPNYFPELTVMLFGMNSEKNLRYFAQVNMTLMDLLAATDDRLRKIGIKYPIERKRILLGLYDFHRQPWSTSSLWTLSTSGAIDCYDVQESLQNILRQLIVIHGTLLYTEQLTSCAEPTVFEDVMEKCEFLRELKNFRSDVVMFKKQMSDIHALSSPKPVLHIPKQDTNRKTHHKAFTIATFLFVSSLVIYVKCRK